MSGPMLTRRTFAGAAGALVVAFSLAPRALRAAAPPGLPESLAGNPMLDAWLRIDTDGRVTVLTGKVELGQGALTALAQIAAEELDVPLATVRMIAGDTASTPDEAYTAGSKSIETSGGALRLAGAEARAILIQRAARRLGIEPRRLTTADGRVIAPDGRALPYGPLAAEGGFRREVDGSQAPKRPADYTLVGRSIPRLDIPAKVTGGASFVQDLRLPGMLHGRILRPPRYGARLAAVDETAARRLPGVVAVLRDGSFLGLVAEREEQAIGALAALADGARWQGGEPLPDFGRIHDHLQSLPAETTVLREKGDTAPAAARTLAATYRKPYIAHAAIGPSCAVARFEDGRLAVWSQTQGVFPLRRDLAKALELPQSAIHVTYVEGSGCYGHNGADDAALDAALLARALPGRPVRVQWMREDEFGWEPFGPAMTMQAKAGLSPDGGIVDWHYEVWSNTHTMRPGQEGGDNLLASWYLAKPQRPAPPHAIPQPEGGGDRNSLPLYDFPRQRIVNHLIPAMPLRVSSLRGLGGYGNVFALESFMDELALASGADPVAFRLRHLGDPRARAVIEAAARRAGWKAGAKGDGRRGRGIGFAQLENLKAYVAVVAEVDVDGQSGTVRIPRVFAAADAGQIINPDGLAAQIEGGVIQSVSWTMKEQVGFDQAQIVTRDWASYPILTFPEIPTVEVALLDHPEERPLGVGEAAQGPTAAALANALAHATGARLRELPLSPARVLAALG
jgi:nicotinate dehydrogenase subunit B